MLSKSSALLLQSAIYEELNASAMYLYLANQCQRIGLIGAPKFFRSESDDERTHYQKHADFMNDRGDVADIPDVDGFDTPIKTLKEAVEMAYNAEVALGEKYSNWLTQALGDDMTLFSHLIQFVEIQTKAIGEYGDLLQRLELAGDDRCAVLIIDKEMGG